jgi:hypothetical protein
MTIDQADALRQFAAKLQECVALSAICRGVISAYYISQIEDSAECAQACVKKLVLGMLTIDPV